jgi:hypothetical protein
MLKIMPLYFSIFPVSPHLPLDMRYFSKLLYFLYLKLKCKLPEGRNIVFTDISQHPEQCLEWSK